MPVGPLPFETLDPKTFERFCFALLAAEGHSELRHWGDAGSEKGCDLVSVDQEKRRVVTQCKRVKELGPTDAEKEVAKVLDHQPDPRPEVWSLLATCALSRETEKRVKARVGDGFETEFTGRTELEHRARKHPHVLELYFGSPYRNDPPLWWISAAPLDEQWAHAFAKDLQACLRKVNRKANVEVGIPSDKVSWPEVPETASVGIVLVSPEALAHSSLRRLWRESLCQPCLQSGKRTLLALDFAATPWPAWLQERFDRVDWPADSDSDADPYRINLAQIISKYIGLTENGDLPVSVKSPDSMSRRLPESLRQRLVNAVTPFAGKTHEYRALASALGLDGRKALDDFETAEERAAAALILATGDDDPSAAGQRVLAMIQDEFRDSPAGFEHFGALRRALQRHQASLPQEQQHDLLSTWLEYIESTHRRLVPAFQRDQELILLDRVYVELQLTPDQQERFTARRLPQLEGSASPDGVVGHRDEEHLAHTQSLEELLALDPADYSWVTRRWIVRGDPGSGKTTLLRHLAAKLAKDSMRRWVPLFQSLPVLLREGKNLLERVETLLDGEGLSRVLDHAGEEGHLLVLLDGLDEVGPEVRPQAEQQIRRLADRWPETPIVVTTRPIGYRRFAGDFRELQLQPLDHQRRLGFLARWFGRSEEKEDHERAITALQELDGPGFEELAGNPLYLTLMALLLEDDVSPSRNRSKLYDQVFELLLEGKHKLTARDKSFEKIQRPELVRQALRLLAESMTFDNCDAERFGKLQERLYRDELESVREELRKVHCWDGKVDRFLEDIAEKVGILGPHDGEDADWRFWHRTFKEALTAERMAEWDSEKLLQHAHDIQGQESRWAEPFALVCGVVDDADALLKQLLEANRDLALRALPTAQNVSDETVREVLELTDKWTERSKVYEQLPELVGDPERCLRLIDRLRQGVRNGNDLYFLDHAAWQVGQASEGLCERAENLRHRIYDELPKVEDPELLRRWRRPDGEEKDLWCRVPAGVGWVGSRDDEVDDDDPRGHEMPRHRVEVQGDCWLLAVPITNAVYAAFDPGKNSHRWKGIDPEELAAHPRVLVTWYEAVSFCRWLACQPGFEGAAPSLPEEEVWEYACRAGSETRYWNGEDEEQLAEVAWFGEDPLKGTTHPVGGKLGNEFGLYDVHGNVWEWTASGFDEARYQGRTSDSPHPVDPTTHPADLAASPRVGRVLRGGCYGSTAQRCRSAYRLRNDPWDGWNENGFRVLLSSAPSGL